MQPGDAVTFSDGLFGIDAPRNVGICLGEDKKGKEVYVELFTVDGPKKAKRDRVQAIGFETELSGDEDGATLRDALHDVIDDLEAARDRPPGEPSDRDLWEAVEEASYTPRELAAAYYDLARPTQDHVASIAEALDSCEPGVGYFRRDGKRWASVPAEHVEAARDQIRKINGLRNALVREETVELDDGYEETTYHPVEDPDLDADDERALETVAEHMKDFVLHDEDRRQVGLGGTDIVAIDGFMLAGFCRHLAQDATGQEGGSISGAYARFLLELDILDVGALYELITARHIRASPFEPEVPDAAIRAADRLEPYEHEPDRRDLRDLETVTIDPADAEDFDDALSLTDDALWVHIADVSRYVEPGTTLDSEAVRRGTSVYLPTRVLPMLPPRLADDLCSLVAGEDRPAVSVKLPLGEGEPEFALSTVHVDENLAYEQVLDWIDEGLEPYASLHELASRWRDEREGLELDTGEIRVELAGEEISSHTKRADPATRLIEAAMVRANEAVAEHLTDEGIALPYRCHPLPEEAAVEAFNAQAEALGIDVALEVPGLDEEGGAGEDRSDEMLEALKEGGKLEIGMAQPESGDGDDEPDEGPPLRGLAQLDADERREWLEPFHEALSAIDGIDDERVRDVAFMKLLGCLGRAVYQPDNVGHFGLGSTCYAHFTSPIRRYPDLVVHRQLKAKLADEDPPYDAEDLEPRCERSTDQQIAAEELEWKLKDVALTFRTLEEDRADVETGVVNGISPGGAFLSLDDGLEARLPVEEIPGGALDVDDDEARLLDRDGETVLKLGQTVAVRLTGRDLAEGRVAATLERIGEGPG